ncbi:TPA: hypothetical protein ACWLXL_004512 [Pseudomonas aeruginosa]
MELPELTPSLSLAIKRLTEYSEEVLDPLKDFVGYASKLDFSLEDDPRFSMPAYPDFEDYDYLHDTSRLKQVYLNDFDFNLEEDREALSRLTRMEFEGNSFDTVARCLCKDGKGLRGNYLLGTERVCPRCGSKAELFLDQGEDTRIWLKCPEGVKKFVNIGFFTTFFNNISIGNPSPKINVPRYFIDPLYRTKVKKQRNGTLIAINQMLGDLEIHHVDLNTFYDHCDRIMEYILVGPGERWSKYRGGEGAEILELYHRYKHIAFCNYLKVPSRYCMVLERVGKEVRSYEHQPETAKLYNAIADTMKSSNCYQLTEKDLQRNVDIVGKNLVALADQFRSVNNPKAVFNKHGINRKHVCAGPVPLTGRSVITSQTGIINHSEVIMPWKMVVTILEQPITNHLYRLGHTPRSARKLIYNAAYRIVPEIDAFLRRAEESRKVLVQMGRNPSIEYLSRRTNYLRVNRDLEDESIKIPITSVGPYNADFDGKSNCRL